MHRHGAAYRRIIVWAKGKKEMRHCFIACALGCGILLLSGCAGGLKIKKEFQDDSFSFDMLRDSASVRVAVADNIDLRAFRKPFEKEYGSDQAFVRTLSRQIADSMKSLLGCSVTVTQNPQEANVLTDQAYSENTLTSIQALFTSTAEEYYFLVETITIENRQLFSTPMVATMGPGSMGVLSGGGYSQTCIVTIQVKLWDVRRKIKVLAYWALGEEHVTMMFYGTALKAAMAKAVRDMVKYLHAGSPS
jgi:hypothetical protein